MPNLSEKVLDSMSVLYAPCSRSVLPKSKTWKDFLWVGDPHRIEGDSMLEHGNLYKPGEQKEDLFVGK